MINKVSTTYTAQDARCEEKPLGFPLDCRGGHPSYMAVPRKIGMQPSRILRSRRPLHYRPSV